MKQLLQMPGAAVRTDNIRDCCEEDCGLPVGIPHDDVARSGDRLSGSGTCDLGGLHRKCIARVAAHRGRRGRTKVVPTTNSP